MIRGMLAVGTWLLLAGWACQGVRNVPAANTSPLGLSVGEDGTLLLHGNPYRGVGVNYFNAFIRTLDEAVSRTPRIARDSGIFKLETSLSFGLR